MYVCVRVRVRACLCTGAVQLTSNDRCVIPDVLKPCNAKVYGDFSSYFHPGKASLGVVLRMRGVPEPRRSSERGCACQQVHGLLIILTSDVISQMYEPILAAY